MKPRRTFLLLLLAGLSAAWAQRPVERPIRQAVRGVRGAVAAGSEYAVEAGMRIFVRGGNAVDAGVAAMLAASVTEYSHFGFGGEAPILIRARDGRVRAISGVGTMPRSATAQFFRERKMLPGEVQQREPNGLPGMVPVAGLMPALVPGMPDAALVALMEFGTLTFAETVAPAIELAEATPIDQTRALSISRAARFLELWPTSKAVYWAAGRAPQAGELFRQPDLARTLARMAEAEKAALAQGASRRAALEAVRDVFYRGEIARRIDAFSRANQGLLRYEDMAAFRAEVEEPVSAAYRGYTVYKPGFWTQGPALLETVNLLEGFDMRGMGLNSAGYLHTLAEAIKLAYADRDAWYGDPRFAATPVSLLSKEYTAERRKLITALASLEFRPGAVEGRSGRHPSSSRQMAMHRIDDELMARDTTCVNAWDKDGIVFSATPSGAWLPAVIAGDTGIPLTQRAQSFLLIEGHPNELAGGKRPRVTLSPTLVVKDGLPALALSTPGGDNQDQSLLQVMLNVIEFGMDAQAAVEAARMQTRHLVSSFDNHAMNPGDLLLDDRISESVAIELSAKGHKLDRRSRWASGAAPVLIRRLPNGVLEAGADPYGNRAARAW